MITFNGGPFDLPFIRRQFPGIKLPPAHIDLRFFLRQLGLRGGLKAIERRLGLVCEGMARRAEALSISQVLIPTYE